MIDVKNINSETSQKRNNPIKCIIIVSRQIVSLKCSLPIQSLDPTKYHLHIVDSLLYLRILMITKKVKTGKFTH